VKTEHKIRLASIAAGIIRRFRSLAGRSDVGLFDRGGIRWELDLNQGIDFAIYLQGGFEPATLRDYERLVRPGDTVLDIGANIGAHTLPLARLVGPAGCVAAFEPTDYAFAKLERNLSLNPDLQTRVTAVQALLVSHADDEMPKAIPSSWSLRAPDPDEEIHPVHKGTYHSLGNAIAYRLDDWLKNANIKKVDFVKIDVDGFEIDVLEGARETLDQFRPIIMMEFAPYVFAERGKKFADLIGLLKQARYQAQEIGGAALELSPELETLIPHGGSINVLLKPQ
jgi:FkbM family methyltransferase